MFEKEVTALNNSAPAFPDCSNYDKRTYTVSEIQDILEISRSVAYNLVHQNLFRSVRVGGNIRIVKKSFDEWLEGVQ